MFGVSMKRLADENVAETRSLRRKSSLGSIVEGS